MDPPAMDQFPKMFESSSEVLPITKQGMSSFDDFKRDEELNEHLQWLKKCGLTDEEVKLFREYEAGLAGKRLMESAVLKSRLENIYSKISNSLDDEDSTNGDNEQPSTSSNAGNKVEDKFQSVLYKTYPEGHPMNSLQELENDLYGHLKSDDMLPVNKRRKILRHLERRKERMLAQGRLIAFPNEPRHESPRPGSLWDVKEMPQKQAEKCMNKDAVIGPKKPTMYTVKDNKILRLEPVSKEQNHNPQAEYQAVDIVMPVNAAEERLLEGTKMHVDDIRKIDRFKDYEPGIPSKVLYLKNIAPSVSVEQVSLLFNQFIQDNGGPIDVRLLSGRMRGQAFVSFQNEETCIQAMDEVNGTILSGRPVIAQFGRNSNRIHDNDDR
ncbi:unnamed protein product [Plutella xylostella]|uniref:(diamondback moth) hypothetical protein n=1 Tax=Plutella xylostella TaxID=51655 RepID=A0A8S4FPY9_PLUXY|nr:unnamed protein product [Plutella xylostella]